MNILQFMPDPAHVPQVSNYDTWFHFLEMRHATFRGFAELEKREGFVRPTIPISTAAGQEVLRILFFRVLEELSESFLSNDEAHRKEELIDATNYLLSTALLDGDLIRIEQFAMKLAVQGEKTRYTSAVMGIEELGQITVMVGGHLADTFRNRAWMRGAQDLYFSGVAVYYREVLNIMDLILGGFASFQEFAAYYIAKDHVLQFRLKSGY